MTKIIVLIFVSAAFSYAIYEAYRRRRLVYHRPISGEVAAKDTLNDADIKIIADVVQKSAEEEMEIRLKVNYTKKFNLVNYEFNLSKKEAETLVAILNEAISKT